MRKSGWIAFALMTFALPMLVLAQPAGGGPGGGAGGPGGGFVPGGGFNAMDTIKQALAASDDEWKVIEPKLQKVMDAQRVVGAGRGGRGGMPGGRGGVAGPGAAGPGGGPADAQPVADNAVSKALADLRSAMETRDTKAEVLTQKITALRTARDKAVADLNTARKALKDILTSRQEAVLISYSFLE